MARAAACSKPSTFVRGVALSSAGADMRAAAARVDALLEGATLVATGYHVLAVRRVERVRRLEVDDADPTVRWFERGGRYRVIVEET